MKNQIPNIMQQNLSVRTMLLGGQRALVAVSGGADSMALLHMLHREGLAGAVAHFDHQTRNGASAEDAAFVARAAEALGLPCFTESQPVEAMASARKESFEMVAREVRYAFLKGTAKANGLKVIATGHHADDQAETILLRIIRGTSPAGLAGIPPLRDTDGVRIIRPLLDCPRAHIIAWLEAEGIAWREDASNDDGRFERNRVRHELLPMLAREFNPNIADALRRLAHLQQMDKDMLHRLAGEALTQCLDPEGRLKRGPFSMLDPALQHRCMHACIHRAGGDASWECVTRAVESFLHLDAGRQVDLGNKISLFIATDYGVFGPQPKADEADRSLALDVPGEALGFGKRISLRVLEKLPEEPLSTYCNAGRQVFDARAVSGGVTIRRRRKGDRFQPLGMDGTKKIKAVYNELGLTRPERALHLIVESGGQIIWIPGHTVSQNAAVNDATTRFVELCLEGPVPVSDLGNLAEPHVIAVVGPVIDSMASLCVYNHYIDLDAITDALGVAPTSAHRRGHVQGKRQPAPVGLWSLEAPDSLCFEDKLKYLVESTTDDQSIWDGLIRDHHIAVRCAVFLSSWTESVELPAELVATIGQRHWPIILSMYSAGGEEILDDFLRGSAPEDQSE